MVRSEHFGPPAGASIGTFGLSVTAGLGAVGLRPLSPLTTNLGYGMVGADGSVDVADLRPPRPRRRDGGPGVVELDEALNGPILAELESMAEPAAALYDSR